MAQTWGDFEVIVSDNASDDATPDLTAEYARADPRVRLVRQPVNVGANGNYNAVAHLAAGSLFKWAAHDDVCAPSYLEQAVGLLDRHATASSRTRGPPDRRGRTTARAGRRLLHDEGRDGVRPS
jgi:GT2 family glycosyltransferase